MLNSSDDALITKYLKTELSEEQHVEFQKRLDSSEEFARRVKDELTMLSIARTQHTLDAQLDKDLNELELDEEPISEEDELIIKYAANKLTEEEAKLIASKRQNDPTFDKKIKEHLERMEAYSDYLGNKNKTKPTAKKGNIRPPYLLLVAATVIFGILLSWLYQQNTRAFDTKEIIAEYYENDKKYFDLNQTTRGIGSIGIMRRLEKLLSNIEKNYENNNYQEVLADIVKIEDTSIKNELALYEGITHSKLGDLQQAEAIFQKIIQNNQDKSSDYYYAHWYLSEIYLKNEDIENAKKHLQIVANNPKDIKTQKVSQILKLLD